MYLGYYNINHFSGLGASRSESAQRSYSSSSRASERAKQGSSSMVGHSATSVSTANGNGVKTSEYWCDSDGKTYATKEEFENAVAQKQSQQQTATAERQMPQQQYFVGGGDNPETEDYLPYILMAGAVLFTGAAIIIKKKRNKKNKSKRRK